VGRGAGEKELDPRGESGGGAKGGRDPERERKLSPDRVASAGLSACGAALIRVAALLGSTLPTMSAVQVDPLTILRAESAIE
jgi:hypothetical protein